MGSAWTVKAEATARAQKVMVEARVSSSWCVVFHYLWGVFIGGWRWLVPCVVALRGWGGR